MSSNIVTVIAEAGVNHNGQLDLAFNLIDVAADSGADYVKFQTFTANALVLKGAPKAEYQIKSEFDIESQHDLLSSLELSIEDHFKLKDYCKQRGIGFLSTAFDLESLIFLDTLNLDFFKIPSGEINNIPLLQYVGKKNSQVLLSTGASTISEVNKALEVLQNLGTRKDNITVLHCTTEYPAQIKNVNLRAMQSMRDEFSTKVGYSDHTKGIEIALAAVGMGATVIEKHFTLSNSMIGPDHAASLEPAELKKMIRAIRDIEVALGTGIKEPTEEELRVLNVIRKSIVAKTDILKGEKFTAENLTTKRPGTGISSAKWEDVIGKVALQNYKADEFILIENSI